MESTSPVLDFFAHFFRFKGRVGRMEYFGSIFAGMLLLLFPLALLAFWFGFMLEYWQPAIAEGEAWARIILGIAIIFAYFISNMSFSVRRAHDIGWSGWTYLVSFIPFVGFVYEFILLLRRGMVRNNVYGVPIEVDPLPARKFCEFCGYAVLILIPLVFVLSILLPSFSSPGL